MAETILQSFLNSQLIKTSDDGNIANLKKAVTEVKKKLESKKTLVILYALVAFDPEIAESEPVIIEVEKIIIKKWAAFKNSVSTTKDTATTYMRAVILEALSQLTKHSDEMAALVRLAVRDVITHYQISDKELGIIRPFLQILANKSEEAGRNSWQTHSEFELNVFEPSKIEFRKGQNVELSEDNLKKQLLAAFVHNGYKVYVSEAENPNQHFNRDWHWTKFAAERAGDGLAKEINWALAKQNKEVSQLLESINEGFKKYIEQLQPFFENVSNEYGLRFNASDRRSQLIWWKQSLYSQSIQTSYRSKSTLENTILTAIDLANMVNPIYPESVDFLLRETLRDVHGEAMDEEIEFKAIVDGILKMEAPIKELLTPLKDAKAGRKLLLNQLGNIASSSEEDISESTGISLDNQVTYSDFAVWLFHNLQALKLAMSK